MEEKINNLTLKVLSLFDKMAIMYQKDPFEDLNERERFKNNLKDFITKELTDEK